MNSIKRETVFSSFDRQLKLAMILIAALAMTGAAYVVGLVQGHEIGFSEAASIRTAPRGFVQAPVEPMPVEPVILSVTVTPTIIVDCAETERAYWACSSDGACPVERFEAIADDLNFCQTPPRR